VQFSWDAVKNRINQRKHGVGFETAARVFLDPDRIERYDERAEDEDRWITIGAAELVVLVVVYTVRGEEEQIIRLISARKANAQEREAYRNRAG
jgi:uncharacterized DUF497 family protein